MGEQAVKLSKAADTVIQLSRAIRTYWDSELPKRHRDYPIINPGEDSGPPPPEEAQLKQFLNGLPPDMVYQLLLLRDLGRDYFGTDNLLADFENMKCELPKLELAIALLMGTVPLANQLADGFNKLKRGGLDPDKLFAKARTRK